MGCEVGEYYYWSLPQHVVKLVSLEPLRPHPESEDNLVTVLMIYNSDNYLGGEGNTYNANSSMLFPIPDSELLVLRLTGKLQ